MEPATAIDRSGTLLPEEFARWFTRHGWRRARISSNC